MADISANGEVATKRAEVTDRVFLNAEGKTSPRARLDSVAARVSFIGKNEVLEWRYEDLSPEVRRAAALFGIMVSVTNAVGNKNLTMDEKIEAAEDRLAVITGGNWSAERGEGGPRNGDFFLAADRWYTEAGKTFTEEMKTSMAAKLNDEETGTDYRKKLQSDRRFAAHLAAIKSERAAERAAKAAAAAAESSASLDELV